jgi:thiopeptide-type bacteriocin biosynthesis protein
MSGTHGNWLSIHVFLSDPVRTERYLHEHLGPVLARWRAEGLLDRWFFIRYWEGGAHLRIRLDGRIARSQEDAIAALSEGIQAFRVDQPVSRDAYYRGHAFDGRPVVVEDLPWFEEGAVVAIDYVPELQRYGGAEAIDANESGFDLSSRLALKVCKATEDSRNARLSMAFILMAAATMACGENMAGLGAYYEQYGTIWASMAEPQVAATPPSNPSQDQLDMLLRLERESVSGWSEGSLHGVWGRGIQRLVENLRMLHRQGALVSPFTGQFTKNDDACRHAVLGIVGSQIHMLNNRLGIPPAGEFLLARMLGHGANVLWKQIVTV